MIQCLSPNLLPVSALVLGVSAIGLSRSGLFRLLRKTRWLFLTMAALFVFFTPGVRLGNLLGNFGVTVEGVDSAIEHCLRLFGQLAWLAVLISRLGTSGIVSGLHRAVRVIPGFDRPGRKLIIRLALTLDAIGTDRQRNWRDFIDAPQCEGCESIVVVDPDWRPVDSAVSFAVILTAVTISFVFPS